METNVEMSAYASKDGKLSARRVYELFLRGNLKPAIDTGVEKMYRISDHEVWVRPVAPPILTYINPRESQGNNIKLILEGLFDLELEGAGV